MELYDDKIENHQNKPDGHTKQTTFLRARFYCMMSSTKQDDDSGDDDNAKDDSDDIDKEGNSLDQCLDFFDHVDDRVHQVALRQGEQEGMEAGRIVGYNDGRKLGQIKGIEYGIELGWMRGVVSPLSKVSSSSAEQQESTDGEEDNSNNHHILINKLRSEKVQRTINTLQRSLDVDFPSCDQLFSGKNSKIMLDDHHHHHGDDDTYENDDNNDNEGDSEFVGDESSSNAVDIMKQMQLIRARFKLLMVQLGYPHFSFQNIMKESTTTSSSRLLQEGAISRRIVAEKDETNDTDW